MDVAIINLAKPGKFLNDVDFFCISDNYWLGKSKPCLTYGLRGIAYFQVSVRCAEQDLHSGVIGGTIHEGMTDLVKLMASLVDSATGEILVDGVMRDVDKPTENENKMYEAIEFDIDAFGDEIKVSSTGKKLLHEDKKSLLMARWRYPTLSLHGIEGAFSGAGAKTVIPAESIGKFSLRLVPSQEPDQIEKAVKDHLEKEFAKVRVYISNFFMVIFGAPVTQELSILNANSTVKFSEYYEGLSHPWSESLVV